MKINKILIVDDSPIAIRTIKGSLPRDRDYEFFEARNGREGLEKFKEVNPDLTFLDLTMPVMGGVECLGKLKELDSNSLVVVVTADVQIKSMKKVIEMGAYRMIKKPPERLGMETLIKDIEKAE